MRIDFIYTIRKKAYSLVHKPLKTHFTDFLFSYRLTMNKYFGLYRTFIEIKENRKHNLYAYDSNCAVMNSKSTLFQCDKKIAVQIHVFYVDLLDEIIENLNRIPFSFDCYFTTTSNEKALLIKQKTANHLHAQNTSVMVCANQGRDVLPFFIQMRPVIDNYDYICHIHTKKSVFKLSSSFGDEWRKYLYHHLFGSKENVSGILRLFESDEKLGIVFPQDFPIIHSTVPTFTDTMFGLSYLTRTYSIPLSDADEITNYPAGTMFWARTKAIKNLILNTKLDTFIASEHGQINHTFAHSVERIWTLICSTNGYTYKRIFNNTECTTQQNNLSTENHENRITFFFHSNSSNIDDNEYLYIKELSSFSNCIIFVSNIPVDNSSQQKVSSYCKEFYCFPNKPKFICYKNALQKFQYNHLSTYNQILFCSNELVVTSLSFSYIFEKMRTIDFWSLESNVDRNRIFISTKTHQLPCTYINSSFFAFSSTIIKTPLFTNFWNSLSENKRITETQFEKKCTHYFNSNNQFEACFDIYNMESHSLTKTGEFYTHPVSFYLLWTPLLSKMRLTSMNVAEKTELVEIAKVLKDTNLLHYLGEKNI